MHIKEYISILGNCSSIYYIIYKLVVVVGAVDMWITHLILYAIRNYYMHNLWITFHIST
jgi:hypothetical protein